MERTKTPALYILVTHSDPYSVSYGTPLKKDPSKLALVLLVVFLKSHQTKGSRGSLNTKSSSSTHDTQWLRSTPRNRQFVGLKPRGRHPQRAAAGVAPGDPVLPGAAGRHGRGGSRRVGESEPEPRNFVPVVGSRLVFESVRINRNGG